MIALLALALGIGYEQLAEARMMIEAFGDEYRNYMRMTGRFLPGF